jgi:predicted RNA-binding Zn-ribbon protein involved in translation (DUF1610 family)
MKITKMISQHRRDFTDEMTCESCGHKEINKYGYDDNYYHSEVIPNMKCGKCGESTISANKTVEIRPTKYPDGMQI